MIPLQSPHQLPVLFLQPLKSISPSSFGTLRSCPLRAVWSAHYVPLLPNSPKTRLGTVVHQLWEAAAAGKIPNELAFDQAWNLAIEAQEQDMLQDWKEVHLVPLRASVSDFEVRRLRCRQQLAGWRTGYRRVSLKAEQTVADSTGTIRGRIDLILTDADGTHLIDLKTGSIIDTEGLVKLEYAQQLKLYAALYHQKTSKWPVSLTLRAAEGVDHTLSWTTDECSALLNEAVQLHRRINNLIEQHAQAEMLAIPSPDNCRHCPFRPACSLYWAARQSEPHEDWPRDAKGDIKHLVRLGNGCWKLSLMHNAETIHIRGLSPERQGFLDDNPVSATFYNLRRESNDRYQQGSGTTGYSYI